MQTALWVIACAAGAALLTLGLVQLVHRTFRRLGRRSVLLAELSKRAHRAFQVTAVLLAVRIAVRLTPADFTARSGLLHALLIAVIVASAWLIASFLVVLEDVALTRFRTDVPDNRQARRIHTQVVMIRRVTIAFVVVVSLGVLLMTFPQVRTVGASLLASAGVIGVVAALAAQSVLGNVIAGLQLAFSDAVRLDDVVVVEGEWGKIQEITLSHVVIQIWDDRRLILPTSYFTTKPFQNWTRTEAAVLGTVELDVDWSAPVPEMREELRRLVEGTQLWDGRVCVLQVTDAVGGSVRLRALVSAADAPTLWDLRCLVREHLVGWVRDSRPIALPRMRAELAEASSRRWQWSYGRPNGPSSTVHGEPVDDARVFGGSDDGDARATAFVGPEHEQEPADESSGHDPAMAYRRCCARPDFSPAQLPCARAGCSR